MGNSFIACVEVVGYRGKGRIDYGRGFFIKLGKDGEIGGFKVFERV